MRSVRDGVQQVVPVGAIPQVFNAIVRPGSFTVTDDHSGRARPDERLRNKAMNPTHDPLAAAA
jgi:hypothetical protein